MSKYEALYRDMFSSSPQRFTGIDGIGWVITISPTSFTRALPCSSHANAATPRLRWVCSPAWVGSVGEPPVKPVHTSVPPEPQWMYRSRLTLRRHQA